MKIPTSKLYQKQNSRLIASTRKKAIIMNSNPGANTVDLSFVDNLQTLVKGVRVSNSTIGELITLQNQGITSNIKCVVDIFDETNVSQMIVAYTY
jgi:hypothetical protein